MGSSFTNNNMILLSSSLFVFFCVFCFLLFTLLPTLTDATATNSRTAPQEATAFEDDDEAEDNHWWLLLFLAMYVVLAASLAAAYYSSVGLLLYVLLDEPRRRELRSAFHARSKLAIWMTEQPLCLWPRGAAFLLPDRWRKLCCWPLAVYKEVLLMALSLLSFALFLYETERVARDGEEEVKALFRSQWLCWTEFAISAVFLCDWTLHLFTTRNKWKYLFLRIGPIADLVASLPGLVAPITGRYYYGLQFLRLQRILRGMYTLGRYGWNPIMYPSSKLLMAILCGLVTLVMMASLIFVVENATLNRPHTGGLVTLLDAVYFIMVMSATVGFGDITPTSELGKLFVIVFIILAIILFPFFFTTIKSAFEQFQVERQYRGPSQHIVVCGYSSTLLDFFMEFYHAGREYIPTKALILAEKKLPTRLQRFFDEPYLSSRVDLLRGKPTSEFDLKRAKLQTSSMCVLLSNGSSEEDDIAVTLGALSVQHFNLAQTILAHVNSLRCKNLLVRANIRNVICEEELKLGLIAQSCVCPGFSTLLGNLLRTFAANQVLESRSRHHLKHMHYMMHSYRSHPPTSPWEQAYERSLGMSICSLERMTALHGLRFVEAVRLCVHYFGCLLIGVRRKTSSTAFYQQPRFDGIVLNPSGEYVIQQGDEGIFITQSRSELLCIEQWEQGRFSRAAMQRRFSQGTRAGWDRVKQRLRRTLPLKSDPQAIRAFIRRCRKETTGRHYRSFSDYEEEEEEEEEEEGVSFSVRSRPTTGSGGMYGTFDQTVRRDVRYHLIPNQKEEKEEMEEEEHGTTGNQVPLLESGKEGVGEEVMEDVSEETGGSASLDILKDILTEEATGQAAPIRRYSHLITSDRRSLHDCTITDVREEPIFRNKNFNVHVVITGNLVGIARFILRLRASDMGGALSEPKPIVVLSPELPSSSLWKSISIFPRVYFVQGQQLDRDNLRRCGVEHAAQIVIISKGGSSSSDKHKSEDEKADSCSDATAVLMYRLLQTMSCHHSFIFLSIRDVTSSKYLPGQKAGRDREPDFIKHPLYTSGRIYYDGLLTTLISQACFQPGIISIVRSLISHQVFLLRVSSFAMQGLVFGEALEELLENSDLLVVGLFRTEFKFDRNKEDEDEEEEQLEEESDRFLLGTTGLVEQTGLYQAGSSGKQPSYNRRYVMTNPPWDMVLRASDCLFVMAPNNVVH